MTAAREDLLVEVRYPNQKEPTSATLKVARLQPDRLLYALDQKREPSMFRLTASKDLGMNRGRLAGSFVAESKAQTTDFYRSIVQGLRAWAARAPKLPAEATSVTPEASPEPPAFSGEGREFGEAAEP
jgi:hypothetical protein